VSHTVRLAVPADHAEVAALFLELLTDEPGPSLERFSSEMCLTTFVVEREGRVAGYLFAQFMETTAYVRHVSTASFARRTGVASALFVHVKALARARGCDKICLNVKPDNLAAIRLYEREGLTFRHASSAHRFSFAKLAGHPVEGATVRELTADRDAEAEATFALPSGQLATARALPGRFVLGVFTDEGHVEGVASFDTGFPGAFPFRVARPELSPALLDGCRRHAKEDSMNVIVENAPEVAAWFSRAGAPARMEFSHYVGAL
jgi:ribosomal protein S18 acetylase RimI-like enzyme